MFKTKTPLLIAALHALGITPGLALAEAESEEQLVVVEAEPAVNEFEMGIGYIDDDAYRFGRYNGMVDQGPYVIGNIKGKEYDGDGGFWRLRGTNLGLDSRYLRLDAGVQGSQQFFIEYDQIPDYENDTGSTPFTNPGSTDLALPAGYDADNIDSFLLPFDQKTERERLGLGGKFQIKSRWQLSANWSQETKEGTDWIGAAMGPSILDNIFKWTNGALLPEPIDYETNKIDASLTYHGEETQLEFAYHGSLFDNNDTSLSWTDPLDDPSNKTDDPIHRPGRISLEPDNQMHQLSAVLGQMLSSTSRLTALASVSLLTQDQDFLPHSVTDSDLTPQDDTSLDALPQRSLDGEVWLYRGQLKLTSNPMRNLRLSAQYSYDERDNQTASNSYTYILADGVPGEFDIDPPINPRSNDPLSYRKQKVDLTAKYRFNSIVSLGGGYEYNHQHRDNDDVQVKTTQEHTVSAKLKVKPLSQLNFDIYGETGRRNGNDYITRNYEHPDLRVSYLADLDRHKVGATINFIPFHRLSFGLKTEYLMDDYTESEIGLRESDQTSALLNFNYQITDKINTHAFYNYEEFTSNNANENKEIEKGTYDRWEADLKDSSNSVGLGFSIEELANKWDAGLDWVYTQSKGQIHMTGYQAPVDKITGVIIGDFEPIETQQFSDLETSLNSLQLWTQYQYSDAVAYKLSYWYERYSVDDWAVDGTINNYNPLENDTISQFLFLGEDTLDYDQHVVGLAVKVTF
ncbi:MAG: MtrB/PioB family decaheme-associated outer membrane protein [Pseudomonadota bacterium]